MIDFLFHKMKNHLYLTFTLLTITLLQVCSTAPSLPTLYEYYTSGGIHSGLNAASDQFTLNDKPYVIFSGTFHYFRVVPERWRPTLHKMKAAGLNAVQTYVAWNEHEDIPGHFDFKSPHLNLEQFIQEVKNEDMFLLLRPGPYICAERELGGLPSWLLRDPDIKLRSSHKTYLAAVKKYWDQLMTIVNRHQFTTSGGPIIALQIENEYGSLSSENHDGYDYIHFLLNETRHSGFKELVYMSNNINITAQRDPARLIAPEILETANGHGEYTNLYAKMSLMRQNQPHRPVFDSEYWTSWLDSWGSPHNRMSPQHFTHQVSEVLFRVNGSLNIYPFIGGTNFGFSSGRLIGHVTTSYDFDAPLTESGNYTEKYYQTRKFAEQLMSTGRMPMIALPDKFPDVQRAHAYGRVKVEAYYPLEKLLEKSTKFTSVTKPVSMELLNLGPGYGQRYGFVLYRTVVPMPIATYEITGPISDRAIFLIDDKPITNILGAKNFNTETLPSQYSTHPAQDGHHLDLLVENMGRNEWGVSDRKGILSGDIILDGQIAQSLSIYSLEFNSTFLEQVTKSARSIPAVFTHTPALYIAHVQVVGEPKDTYIQLKDWTKGVVFVNGFNLGRYWVIGPQKTLYLPGPLLRPGQNQIAIFELHQAGNSVEFLDHMHWSN